MFISSFIYNSILRNRAELSASSVKISRKRKIHDWNMRKSRCGTGDRDEGGPRKREHEEERGSVRRQLITAFPRFPSSIVDTESRVIVI